MTSASGAQFVPIETLTGSPLSYEPLDSQVADILRSEQVSGLWHTPMLEELTVDFRDLSLLIRIPPLWGTLSMM